MSRPSLTDFFERIVVINLPQRTDRRRDMETELRRIDVPLEQVTFFPAIRPDDPGPFWSIGVHGCYMSHRNVLEQAHRDRIDRLLVLEDDLSFSRNLPDLLPDTLAKLSEQAWALCHLGHREDVAPPHPDRGGLVPIEPSREVQTAHFLAWHGSITGELVEFLDAVLTRPGGHPLGGPMQVDGAFSTFRRQRPELPAFLAAPSLGHQRSSRSDINSRNRVDQVPVLRDVAEFARGLRRRLRG